MQRAYSRSLRTAACVLPMAFMSTLAGLTGCSSDRPDSDYAEPSSSAIQTSHVSRAPAAPRDEHLMTLAYPTGDRSTSTLLVEQVGGNEVRLNHDYRYGLRVTNLTAQTVRGITLRSRAPEGLRVVKTTATTQPLSDGQNVYTVGDLGPRESRVIEMTVNPEREGAMDECYAISYQPPTFCMALRVVNPVIRVTARGPAEADICEDVVYKYTVSNTGTGFARNVTFRDTLPEGVTTVDGKNVVAIDLGDIPEGQRRDVTARLRASRPGAFSSEAIVSSEGDVIRSQAISTTIHAPKLAVAVKGPDQDYVGKEVGYQVTVTNTGDAPARDAAVRLAASDVGRVIAVNPADGARPAVTLATAGTGGNDVSLGTIKPGESRTLNVTATGNQGGVLSLNAAATAACSERVAQSAQTRIQTIAALLLEAVDEADPVRVGDNVIYDIAVTNQGTGPDTNVRVTATVPEGEQFVSANGATEASANGSTVTFAPVATLAAKQTVRWKVVVKAAHVGDVQFRVNASSDSVKAPAEKTEPTKLY
ncbi:MAG: hypothetical protein JWP03_1967 [Phycisphaerales bacterium]|nr:hypothetical protein [Phycisphaerales bacterium]